MKVRDLVLLTSLLSAPVAFARPMADVTDAPTQPARFTVSEKTQVPNLLLKPGDYSIRILDHLRDRLIMEIDGRNSVHTTFLALPAGTMSSSPAGPIVYSLGPKGTVGKAALKGFSFPGGVAVEFVYPKGDAVSLAKANDTRVMAIDPASEGRVPAAKLSANDMQMISLWMLQPASVGPNDQSAGISATKYQAPTQVASTSQPAPAPAVAPATAYAAAPSTPAPAATRVRTRTPASVQVARVDIPAAPRTRSHANVTALPHTAGNSPLFTLLASLFLGLAGILSVRRLKVRA